MKSKIKISLLIILVSTLLSGCTIFEKKQISGLQVQTNNVNASIFLDGKFLDKTPYKNDELKPGTYTLKIQPEDDSMPAYDTGINLNQGMITVVDWYPGNSSQEHSGAIFEMKKLPVEDKTEVSIITIPDNAIVKLSDHQEQFAPMVYYDLEAKDYNVVVSLPGYKKQEHTISVTKGHRMDVTVKLSKIITQLETQPDELESTTIQEASSSSQSSQSSQVNQTDDKQNLKLSITPTSSPAATPTLTIQPTTQDLEDTDLSSIMDKKQIIIKKTNFYLDGQEVLRVRTKPNTASQQIGLAIVGEKYDYLDEQTDDWFKIEFDNQTGWVSKKYAQLID